MANSPTIQEQIVVHGALPVVLHMAGDASDLESQRQALLTLSNLSANEINHSSMMNKGVMKVLTNGFLSEDLDVREYSSYCIANICSNPDYLAMVGDSGGIPPLIQLTKSDNVNTLCLGMAALRRLANAEENWSRLIAEGILDSLASSGFSTELEIQRETAATICSLSLSEPHRVEMAYKCIQAMIQLSRSNDHDVSRQSIGSLANLAEDVNTHEYIARAGGSKCFVSLEKHNSLEIHREATRGIANLLSSFRHQSTIIQEGIPGLVQLSYSGDDEVCYHAALSFRKLCPNIKSHPVMVYAGVYKALFNLISLPNVNTQHQAASALRDLSANPEYKLKCAEDGGIEVMVHLLRQPDQLLQALSLSSLRHLSTEQALKHPILQERALRPALRSISSNNEDIHLQCAGLLANLSELYENQVTMVEESAVVGLVTLAFSKNIEVQQDSSRALANLASNEESHLALYKQGALTSLVKLSESTSDLAQRYSAMGLRFLASNPEVRVLVVQQRKFDPFIHLASSDLLEFRRTAATAFASFTLHEANKPVLVQGGAVAAILSLAVLDDLAIKRDAAFALANLSDTPELQSDLVREGLLKVIADLAFNDDVRVQRDAARTYTNLTQTEEVRSQILSLKSLPSILNLAKSLDVACQRYSSLSLCNLCASSHKVRLVEEGIVRPLIFLSRFPDTEIQRYAALALAGLALGGQGNNKVRIVEEGAMKCLIDLIRFPDIEVQLAAAIAINSITLGNEQNTKAAVMTEKGVEPLIFLLNRDDRELICSSIYCLGSLCENEEVKANIVENGAIAHVVRHCTVGDIEIKRAAGYFLATICEQIEYHSDLEKEHAYETIIGLSRMEDVECQEYAAFALAHLASNRDNQVKLVGMGVVRPLVAMLSSDAEPKHYAGLALLKLADNFENHLRIAEEGGIQALLRLGRSRATDDQLQYKAALTLGQLASNAVKMMPTKINRPTISSHVKGPSATVAEDGSVNNSAGASEGDLPVIGTGSRVMNRLRSQVAAQKEKARDMTIDYLDRSVAQTQQERFLRKQSELKAMVTTTTENLDSLKATDDLMQPSRARGNISLSRSADQSIGNKIDIRYHSLFDD